MAEVTMNALDFLERWGRLPRLGDLVPPWEYQGWLLPYIAVGERWDWYLEGVTTGRLPSRPIPRITFDEPDRQVFKSLETWASWIGGWSGFETLLEWLAWGLSLGKTLPQIDCHEKLYRGVDLKPFLITPYDYFGAHISEYRAAGWNPTGFYPTPHPVCELMTSMVRPESMISSVCDPCVGTGRMLLHASNYSVRLYGNDIDRVVLLACKINGALYAPWLSYPFPVAEALLEEWWDRAIKPDMSEKLVSMF